ncbi:unnamed protein product [Arabidopsis halleri]
MMIYFTGIGCSDGGSCCRESFRFFIQYVCLLLQLVDTCICVRTMTTFFILKSWNCMCFYGL